MVKRTAAKAGINGAVSPHWLCHAHGLHAIDRGASLPEVQKTLATATSPPPVAICMPVRTHRATYTSIPGCFFDDEQE
jgi:hypothetical protein